MSDLVALPTFMGLAPKELPKFVPVELRFSTLINTIDFDLALVGENAVMSTLQSVWVDNIINTNPLDLLFIGSNQRIRVASFSQGMFPLIAQRGIVKVRASTTTPADYLTVPLLLLNVPQPYFTHTPT